MTSEFLTTASIEHGRLIVRNRQALEHWARHQKDGELHVTIQRAHATRSVLQNRWYFGGILGELSTQTGYTIDELHEWAKMKFLPKHLALTDGNGVIVDEFVVGGSTTGLNRIQFGEYCEAIRQFAAEHLDVNIPDPDRDWREHLQPSEVAV